MSDDPIPPDSNENDNDDALEEEASEREPRRRPGNALGPYRNDAFERMLRDVIKVYKPNPIFAQDPWVKLGIESPLQKAFKDAMKVSDWKPTYDFSWMSDLIDKTAITGFRPPLRQLPGPVTGALYSDLRRPVEANAPEDVDEPSLAELVKRDFDTGDLDDTEIDDTVEGAVDEYRALDEEEQSIASSIAEMVRTVQETGRIQVSHTAALIKLEEHKIALANKRADEAEERTSKAEKRQAEVQARADARGRLQSIVAILGVIVAIVAIMFAG